MSWIEIIGLGRSGVDRAESSRGMERVEEDSGRGCRGLE